LRRESLDVPRVFEAVPQQLRLRLEKGSTLFGVIVIDHLDKAPVEN
jgi:uncharacterized protein (TIGR03435 family)